MLKISSIFYNYKAYWICKNSVPKIVYVSSTFSELRRSDKGESVFEIKEKKKKFYHVFVKTLRHNIQNTYMYGFSRHYRHQLYNVIIIKRKTKLLY